MSWQEVLWRNWTPWTTWSRSRSPRTGSRSSRTRCPCPGSCRRAKIRTVLAQEDMDATKLAETIGTSTSAIRRLSEEGRANERRAA